MRHSLLTLLLISSIATSAHSTVIQTVEAPDGRIDLHDESGPCVNAGLRAEFTDRKTGEKIAGCWVAVSKDLVQIAFLDGDIARVPTSAFKRPAES